MMNKINNLMEYMEITPDELKFHAEAHEEFSLKDSDRLLKKIPDETRNKIGRFYKKLRDEGIYYYPGKKPMRRCTYLEKWQEILEENPRSQGEKITQKEIAGLLKNSIQEVISKMKEWGE